ncbi:lysylphosphatidylglycerol synthase transmembrane domain-containing protein [Haloplanus halobius]|uniref:lysylphosphatidylglycerol synthase transmembrane domain-containing protein n=1 Tax=Haloplanus halobius TaxID=2934938 RepID=UPI00200ED45C|nr:flippase-like domain-containing protein [Haloplanus sp. XH21]
MVRGRLRATILGFAGAAVVFAILFSVAGVDELITHLVTADLRLVTLVFLATLGWLAAWGFALRIVLGVLGVSLSVSEAFFIFTAAMFSNNVTPFGQAGGEPITALLISRVTDTEYERGLAAIASVDTLNFVPSITIALVGVGYFVTEATLGTSRRLELALVAVAVLAIGVPTIVYLGWTHRYRLEARLVGVVTPVIRRLATHLPRIPVPTVGGIERRINGFFRAIERVATNPRGLALALALSAAGWFFQMLGLWLAFRAIGTPIPLSVALFVVPIGAIAGVTPLPGGAGGIESVLVVLLVAAPLPGVSESIAIAAVVVFRGMVYWTPTILGGLVTGVVSVRARGA